MFDHLPRARLATLPTPLERGPEIAGGVRLWVKRDDLTGLGMGGNKARKLEFLCGAALDAGARSLVTVGAGQSNHCRMTAAAGAVLGLETHLVLAGDRPDSPTGNQLLSTLFGAQLHYTGAEESHWGELEIARELQTELMAASMQSVTDELDASAPFRPRLAFHYQPSAHLAGDFFQFLSVSRDAFAFILCDVMGHGVKAALVTTLLRGLLANLRADERSPAEALRLLNDRLCLLLDRPPLPRFVTALYALVDIRARRVRIASAGHPWPLRRRSDGGTAAVSESECGPALGLIRGAAYEFFEFPIEKGDRLLFFTDGWIEDTRGLISPEEEAFAGEKPHAPLRSSRSWSARALMIVASMPM